MFIISKDNIYIKYGNIFKNFIQKQVSTKLNQQAFCVDPDNTYIYRKIQHSFKLEHENGKETPIHVGKALNTAQLPLLGSCLSSDRMR